MPKIEQLLNRKLSPQAVALLNHMRDNSNFLTISEANTYQKPVRELRELGYILNGHCESGVYTGADGYIVLAQRKIPQKREFQTVAVAPGASNAKNVRRGRPKKMIVMNHD